jgi:hypothetical protein
LQSAEAETLAAAAEQRLKNSEAKLTDSRQRVSTLEGKIHVIEAEQVRMQCTHPLIDEWQWLRESTSSARICQPA